MLKKRLLLALAAAVLSFGNTVMAGNTPSVFSSFDCTGGGNETFANIGAAASSYATRTWTGNNGIAWSATDARTDQDLNGDAIALRTGILKNTTTVAGGVGTLTFNYKRVFTGNSTLKVYVNGVQYGGDVTVSSETTAVFSQLINVTGNVTIEIRNSGNRVIVDDVAWTCYATPTGAEIQLADAAAVNKDCGDLDVNYGAQLVGVYSDRVFTVKNTGGSNLVVSSLVLSNTADFSIISPSVPFTVAPSASAIVLVRFNSATSGSKTSTLTINSNDADEAACVVDLAGIAQEPCVAPGEQDPTIGISNITYSSADMTVEDILADAYIAIVSTSSTLSGVPQDGVNYTVGNAIGGGTVAYTGDLSGFDLSGLAGSTQYYVFIFAYNANCGGGPLYTEAPATVSFTTLVAPCIGGSETFANIGASSSAYATRTWTGDNGVAWSATDARTDQTLTSNAIAMRTGILTNTSVVNGGVGTLSFNYKRVFTGNSTLKVFVNNVQYGGDITVSSDSTAVYSQLIDVAGSVTIRIENSGNRVIIDDLVWSCFETPDRPEILLLDSNLSPKACGELTIDLGAVEVNTLQEATFTIKNSGLQNLVINSISLDDNVNYTILAPATLPATIASLGTLDVTVHFNSATTGNKPAVLTIASNDADEASCVVNFGASVQSPCVAPVITGGSVAISNLTSSSADVTVSAVTATSYIALISTDVTITTAPTNGTAYAVGTVIGNATVAYSGNNASFTIDNLNPETSYTIYVYAFNTVGCIDGPVYSAAALQTKAITTEAPCVGNTETFANLGANASSYATRNWTGDNGVTWTATDARTDQTLNGKAVAVRTGSITNTVPVSGGIGTLTFNYQRVFTGNSTLKVFVNGVQYGGDITVSLDTPTAFSFAVNVAGDVTVELENSGNRIIVDDLAWDCYSAVEARNLNLGLPTNKVAETTAVTLYPNPNNGQFQIDLATENADVVIYNTLGKKVLDKKVSDNEVINLNGAEKGIYMVVITSGSSVSTKKIVIN